MQIISQGQVSPNKNVLNQDVNLITQERYSRVPEDLKSKNLWCCYNIVNNEDPAKKPKKVPKNPCTGQNALVNNPATLTDFDTAQKAVLSEHYDGLNFTFYYDPEIVGIDLDNVLENGGSCINSGTTLIKNKFIAAGAYVETSPSGRGLRIICRKKPETVIRFGKGTKSTNFEMYGAGDKGRHFLSITGDSIQEADPLPYCDDALKWFNDTYFFEKPNKHRENVRGQWEESPELSNDEIIEKLRRSRRKEGFELLFDHGHTGSDNSGDDIKLCSMIGFYVQDPERIEEIFNQSKLVRPKWENRPDYRKDTIGKALRELSGTWQHREGSDSWEQELEDHVEEFNSRFASVVVGGKHRIMKLDIFSKERSFIPENELAKVYRNTSIQIGVNARGTPLYKTHFMAWYDHPKCRVYQDGVIFKPGYKFDSRFNLWQGFAVQPAEGDCEIILSHIRNIICSGNESVYQYILDWIAYSVQHPDRPAGTAIVVRGSKGSGKGTLGHFLMSLWGSHGLHISNSSHLTGNFNAHLAETCFLFADEAFFSGDRKHERVLKALITEPVITVERKGLDAIQQPNFLKIFMATNSDFAVPASKDERRFLVTDCSDARVGDFKYFDDLHSAIDDNSVKSAFLNLLLNRNISAYKSGRIPETNALKDQRFHNFEPHQSWLAECLIKGAFEKPAYLSYEDVSSHWLVAMPSMKLFDLYEAWCKEKGVPHWSKVSAKFFCAYIKKVFPEKKHVGSRGINGVTLGAHREAVNRFEVFEKVNLSDFEGVIIN